MAYEPTFLSILSTDIETDLETFGKFFMTLQWTVAVLSTL